MSGLNLQAIYVFTVSMPNPSFHFLSTPLMCTINRTKYACRDASQAATEYNDLASIQPSCLCLADYSVKAKSNTYRRCGYSSVEICPLTSQEHLQHFRSAIVRQEADDSSKSPNLGSLFYWQSAHQASERERLALVDEVAKLEKELEMLQGGSRRASLDVGEPSAFFAGQEQPYRGVNDDTGEAANDKDNTSHPTNFAGAHVDCLPLV